MWQPRRRVSRAPWPQLPWQNPILPLQLLLGWRNSGGCSTKTRPLGFMAGWTGSSGLGWIPVTHSWSLAEGTGMCAQPFPNHQPFSLPIAYQAIATRCGLWHLELLQRSKLNLAPELRRQALINGEGSYNMVTMPTFIRMVCCRKGCCLYLRGLYYC